MPNFSSDWFSQNIPAWRALLGGWDNSTPKTVLEIGSFEGRSTVWIVENLLHHPESAVLCVDVFAGDYFDRFLSNTAFAGRKVQALKGASFERLARLAAAGQQVDFAYIDGSHRASAVLEDLVLTFRLVRPGGLIICDDYLGNQGDILGSAKIAIDAFTTIFGDQIEIVGGQPLYQLAFRKKGLAADDDVRSRQVSPARADQPSPR